MAAELQTLRTGFIGVGQQGGPMALRMLQAGYPLTVWARRPEALVSYLEVGGKAATSPEELAGACDYIAICVVDDAAVRDICARLIPAMAPGTMLVIHSTILPETCEALFATCQGHGIGLIDAPVSGGGAAAANQTLTVMCGATKMDFERARPVLESFAGKLAHLGLPGAGQRAKIVNNALMAANMGLAQAALLAGERLGIDRAPLADLIKASSGRSFGFEVFARLPRPEAFSHGAPLLLKDVNLLSAILPGDHWVARLVDSATGFLDQATQGLAT